MPGSSEVLIKY